MADLEWGQTPWDNLDRETLLVEVRRMHAALLSAQSALKLCGAGHTTGFWSLPSGSGARALARVELALGRSVAAQHNSEDVYRAYFRYAADLLFSPELGFGWTACDGCPHLYGSEPDQESLVGKPCQDCAREGRHHLRRLLEWRDLDRKS